MPRACKILLEALFSEYKLPFFTKGNYNINLFGIRAKNRQTDTFNDLICIAFKSEIGWKTFAFPATTDPGASVLGQKVSNPNGTAFLPVSTLQNSGSYKFMIGRHKNKYPALVQAESFKIIRDNNKDGKALSLQEEKALLETKIYKGLFGLNIHHAADFGYAAKVGNWSWGCQVFQSAFDWEKFFAIIKHSTHFYGDKFTYTLFAEEDIRKVLGLTIQSFSFIMNLT